MKKSACDKTKWSQQNDFRRGSNPANMQDRANVGHQFAGLAKRRQICQRFANVANVLPTSLQTP